MEANCLPRMVASIYITTNICLKNNIKLNQFYFQGVYISSRIKYDYLKRRSHMDLAKIGKYIAEKRKALGLTQKQLAEKLGMSDKSVSKWERGNAPETNDYVYYFSFEFCDE